MNIIKNTLSLLLPLLMVTSNGNAAEVFWQETQSPQVVGDKVLRDLLSRPDYMMYISDHFNGIHYAEAAVGYGAMKLLQRVDDKQLLADVLNRYQEVPGTDHLIQSNHVDANVYGIVPLQIYLVNGNSEKRDEGLTLADAQWHEPLADGMTKQTRYWIDDIWMINSLQVQAYRVTADKKYLDRAALQTQKYLEKLQQENGLFFHGPEAHFYWGRGNGWVAAGLADLISELPQDHPRYLYVAESYKKMMASLLKYQAEDGMWRQLVDKPESWQESSSTAMFGYAMALGVKTGLLPQEQYRPAYEKAWLALVQRVDGDGKLTDVCVGTGQSKDINYYLERPRTTGDFHGQAPLLWFAEVLLRD